MRYDITIETDRSGKVTQLDIYNTESCVPVYGCNFNPSTELKNALSTAEKEIKADWVEVID